jgi:hypothetical protein
MHLFSQSSVLSMPQIPAFSLRAATRGRETAAKEALQQTMLYSSAGLDIAYNRLHQYLYCNWKGTQTAETLQEGIKMIMTLVKVQGGDRLLIDNRQVKGAFGAAWWWVKLGLLSALHTHGLARVSWLVPSDPLIHLANALSLRQVSGKAGFVQCFSDENAAKLWLLEQLNRQCTMAPKYC